MGTPQIISSRLRWEPIHAGDLRCAKARPALANLRGDGFTVVELLFVIAIIVVLMAILMPLVSRARESAHQSICSSNLRQLMSGFVAFAQDHDGQLPGGYWDLLYKNNDPNPDHWDWLRGDPTQWTSAPAGGTLFAYMGHNLSAYRCPSLDLNPPAPTASVGPMIGSNGQYDYVSMLDLTGAMLGNIHGDSQLTFPDGHTEGWPTPVIVEGDPTLLNGFQMKSWRAGTDGMAHTHGGGGQYAASDGSVQWINEPPGGCWNWNTVSASGRWVSFGTFPFYWGAWNRQ